MPKQKIDPVQQGVEEFADKLADEIKDISGAMRGFMNGRLRRSTIILLVSKAAGVNLDDTSKILAAVENLEKTYLK